MPAHSATLPRTTWVLLALLTLGWGMNWPMIKMAVTEIPVWTFRALCIAGGAAGMFALARVQGLRIRVERGEWQRLAAMALFNVTLWNVLVSYGVQLLPAGRSAILAYTMPLWTVLLSTWVLGERLTRRRVAGVTLGMGGLLLLLGDSLFALGGAPGGTLMILAGALSWSVGTLLLKKYPVALPTTSLTAWNFLLGGIPVVAGALVLDSGHWRPIGAGAAVGLAYNVLVAFVLCHWLWFRIVTLAPAGVSALGTLMTPVVGVLSGMAVLGERPGFTDFAAMGLILAALATVLIAPRNIPSSSAPARR